MVIYTVLEKKNRKRKKNRKNKKASEQFLGTLPGP